MDERLQTETDERLTRLRAGFGEHLRAAFDELIERLGLLGGQKPGYFLHPLALPVLQLPRWCAASARRRGGQVDDAIVMDLVEAAATGYLHVRLQDDLLDEGEGALAPTTMLADALLARHTTLTARSVGAAPAFWPRFESLWTHYNEAMLLESALHEASATYGAAEFERVLDRSRPLSLPGAAVFAAAGGGAEEIERDTDELERFVDHLSRGHQLYTDLLDAEKDLRNDNLTYVVRRFGGAEDSAVMRQRLYFEGGFDEVFGEVMAEHRAAEESAARLGFDDASGFIRAREEHMKMAQREAFGALFSALLGGA